MLQRLNAILMVVVLLAVIGVGTQVFLTQRYNTLALNQISARLADLDTRDRAPSPAATDAGAVAALEQRLAVEEAKTQAVSDFLTSMLTAADPAATGAPERGTDVAKLLDEASTRIDEIAKEDEPVAAALRESIREAYARLQVKGGVREYPKLAPFTAVTWESDRPSVHVDGRWHRLLAINGIGTADIMAFCTKTYPGKAHKRFSEDLVQVLSEMGHAPGATVELSLRPLEGNALPVVMEAVPMTAENRRAVLHANRTQSHVTPVQREHAADVPEALAFLTTRVHEGRDGDEAVPRLTAAQAQADLDLLEAHLLDQASYLTLKDTDYRAGLDAIRAGLGKGIRADDFAIQLHKLIARLGDAHAGVEGVRAMLPGGHADFLLGDTGDGVVALRPDRSAYLDADHPFVAKIDGIALDEWLAAAAPMTPDGSPQSVRRRSLRTLRSLTYLGRELEFEGAEGPGPHRALELVSADGASRITHVSTLATSRPIYGTWPRTESHRRPDGLGYLRLAEMSSSAAAHVTEMMERFRDTDGLIIDVRGNGGGSREALRALAPYLMAPDAPPFVANVAAYRLSRGFRSDHLGARFLYRADDPIWSAAQREAIAVCAAGFEPEWAPPADAFSAWHYFVLGRTLNPEAYHYDRPVVLLVDAGCFSATDIFAAALKDLGAATLIGTATSGGSGRSRSVTLWASGLRIRLSSMASFRPDGRLYDGRGVQPDILVRPIAGDFLVGGTDTVLDTAVQRMTENAAAR